MVLLLLGVLLFALVHFVPSLTPTLRHGAITKIREDGYKGLFSLLLLASFALMIIGWRSADYTFICQPPRSLHTIALCLLLFAFLLLVVSTRNSRLRLVIRHPQLTGVAVWGVSHLLLNGDKRSIVLFGGMALWAIVEIVVIYIHPWLSGMAVW